ncbi:MAG TPA: hypothetical protein VLD86_07845 [Ilumatobacteraceae bacterium]|nr:hypothetical protein [Ilumatobacteraceae bacterium]
MFDRIVIVDWSSAATPKRGKDSIWTYARGDSAAVNHSTRAAAFAALLDLLRSPGRTLIGLDFPLGYPAGFATAAKLDGRTPWAATWQYLTDLITDDDRNRNNRWVVAADLNQRLGELRFWGVPPRHAGNHLTIRKPLVLDEFRIVESRLKRHGKHPFSTWQLLGAGSVGSQTLTGIPVVQRLRQHPDIAERARVWPFETGLTKDPTIHHPDAIVIAEVWPSAIPHDPSLHHVKDACQVMTLARHYADLDAEDRLAALFEPDLAPGEAQQVVDEEAWILGVT